MPAITIFNQPRLAMNQSGLDGMSPVRSVSGQGPASGHLHKLGDHVIRSIKRADASYGWPGERDPISLSGGRRPRHRRNASTPGAVSGAQSLASGKGQNGQPAQAKAVISICPDSWSSTGTAGVDFRCIDGPADGDDTFPHAAPPPRDGPLKSSQYINALKHIQNDFPHIQALANQTAASALARLGQTLDPVERFFNTFKNAQLDDSAPGVWSHFGFPDRSERLWQMPITHDSQTSEESTDNLNKFSGIYLSDDAVFYGDPNREEIHAADLIRQLRESDFLQAYEIHLQRYWSNHLSSYAGYLKKQLSHIVKQKPSHELSNLARTLVLAVIGEACPSAFANAAIGVRHLEIDGHQATDAYVFEAGKTLMLVAPHTREFMIEFRSHEDMAAWVVKKAASAPQEIALSFGILDREISWRSVDSMLVEFAKRSGEEGMRKLIRVSPQSVEGDWSMHAASEVKHRVMEDIHIMRFEPSAEVRKRYLRYFLKALPIADKVPMTQDIALREAGRLLRPAWRRDLGVGVRDGTSTEIGVGLVNPVMGDIYEFRQRLVFRYFSDRDAWIVDGTGGKSRPTCVDDYIEPHLPYESGDGSLVATKGMWKLEPGNSSADKMRDSDGIATVNDQEDVAICRHRNQTYLSRTPGGWPFGSPLVDLGKGRWATREAVQVLPPNWTFVPGRAEQYWFAHAFKEMNPVHLTSTSTPDVYRAIDGGFVLKTSMGYLPLTKSADGWRAGFGGPPMARGSDGQWSIQMSRSAYVPPLIETTEVASLTAAFEESGTQVSASHALTFIKAMRNAGFRGGIDELFSFVKKPRPLALTRSEGRPQHHGLSIRSTEVDMARVTRAQLHALRHRLPDDQALAVALVEYRSDRQMRLVAAVPPGFEKVATKIHCDVVTSWYEASPEQLIAGLARQVDARIRHVTVSREPSMAQLGEIYLVAPNAVVLFPFSHPAFRRSSLQEPREPALMSTGAATCEQERIRRDGRCTQLQTAIRNNLETVDDYIAQSLNHQIILPQQMAEGSLYAHNHRLIVINHTTGLSREMQPGATGGGETLVPREVVTGRIVFQPHFGRVTSMVPGTVAWANEIEQMTVTVMLDGVVEGVNDQRIIRFTGHWISQRRFRLVGQPMPGEFLEGEFEMPDSPTPVADLSHTTLRFRRLRWEQHQDMISQHVHLWDALSRGRSAAPMPQWFIRIPEIQELRDLMVSRGWSPQQVERIRWEYSRFLDERVTREALVRHIGDWHPMDIDAHASPSHMVAISPAPQSARASTLAFNSHFANGARQMLEGHLRATGIRMANIRSGPNDSRQARAVPMVLFVQAIYRERTDPAASILYRPPGSANAATLEARERSPNYYDIVLAAGAGNCDDLALTAARAIVDAGGAAVTWQMPGAHTFVVVGAVPSGMPSASFGEPGWESLFVYDPWLDIICPAPSYRDRFRQEMHRRDALGHQIAFRRSVGGYDWYSPVDQEWLALTSANNPFQWGYAPPLPTRPVVPVDVAGPAGALPWAPGEVWSATPWEPIPGVRVSGDLPRSRNREDRFDWQLAQTSTPPSAGAG